eukprot:1139421-Pelagomonas_calceolata.AAC.3
MWLCETDAVKFWLGLLVVDCGEFRRGVVTKQRFKLDADMLANVKGAGTKCKVRTASLGKLCSKYFVATAATGCALNVHALNFSRSAPACGAGSYYTAFLTHEIKVAGSVLTKNGNASHFLAKKFHGYLSQGLGIFCSIIDAEVIAHNWTRRRASSAYVVLLLFFFSSASYFLKGSFGQYILLGGKVRDVGAMQHVVHEGALVGRGAQAEAT